MAKSNSKSLLVVGALFLSQAVFSLKAVYPSWQKDFAPKTDILSGTGLSPDQLLFALSGFREMVAGILWVRCDAFFDEGNYDAMLPLIRLCTLLDPKQLDVFGVGMWHLAYNFTDEDQRSDRRYIPSALALGKEGIKNNPETYEMFGETAWIWFNKIDDNYPMAVKYYEQANERKDILPMRRNILSAAYLRNGEIDKALEHWHHLFELADTHFKEEGSFQNRQSRDTVENNMDTLLVRMGQRGYFAQKDGRSVDGYDISPPFDIGFSVKVTIPQERMLKIDANWNVLPAGTRIRCILRDADYPTAGAAIQDWDRENKVTLDPPRNLTWMQELVYVRNRKGTKTVDMVRDPSMYPFTADKYVLEFYWNPRSGAAFMQDKMGFNGEGMTDQNFLNKEVRPGQRVIYTKFELTKEQILRLGEWTDKVPSVQTSNYKSREAAGQTDDVILVPSLRSDAPAQSKTEEKPPVMPGNH